MAKTKDAFHPTDEELVEEELQDAPFQDFELPGNDDEFELDLADPNVSGLLPEGIVNAYVTNLEKTVSQKGDPMWIWYFTPMVDFSANTLRLYTVLTPSAAWKVIETLTALGLGKAGEKAKFKADDAMYRLCQLEIIHEEYRGQTRPSVSRVLPHPDGIGKKYQPFSGVPEPSGNAPF